MTDPTPLDAAHAAMEAAPADDAARLAYWGIVAGTELFLLIEGEPDGDAVTPALFDVEGAHYLLAFDREDRLAAFAGGPAPYAALPGRGLVAMVAGQGIGIALNADAPSAHLMPPEVVDWLAGTLARAPEAAEARPRALHPPRDLPAGLVAALDLRLAASAGYARAAFLAEAEMEGGARSLILALVEAVEAARPALAAAVNEALAFSGAEGRTLDVIFIATDDPILPVLTRVGLRIDLPAPPVPIDPAARPAPGSDPDRPPRLR